MKCLSPAEIKYLRPVLFAMGLSLLCAAHAGALSYNIAAPEGRTFGKPTSDTAIIYEAEPVNVDRSKNTALIAPGFGSPTSYLPNSGEHLTPNLVPGALSGGLISAQGSVSDPVSTLAGSYPTVNVSGGGGNYPATGSSTTNTSVTPYPATPAGFADSSSPGFSYEVSGYTEVSGDLYYSGGHLGTLSIPAIKVNVKIYEGTGTSALAKGIGHFSDTSIWAGNVCLAGHNRGSTTYFGQIHTLKPGAKITLTTKLGTRTYSVTSVEKISYTDNSKLASTTEDCITLYTCVRNESAYRWCVRATAD